MKNIKPSELIKLAIKDLEIVESQPELYEIKMSEWHMCRTPDRKCWVCLAGAVMAVTLKVSPDVSTSPFNLEEVEHLLLAINEFRTGYIYSGLKVMNINKLVLKDREITRYADNPTKFKSQMLEMANDLEAKGL